jgi:exodeoxyribonuclease V alpha subunit
VTGLDVRIAGRATGLLRAFNDAGVLRAADVHVAQRLGALGGESDERVLLAAALSVRGVRQGSVATRLDAVAATVTADEAPEADGGTQQADPLPAPAWPPADAWLAVVAASPLVATEEAQAGRPLRLEDGSLWLDRYWQQEVAVAADLLRRAAQRPPVDVARLRDAVGRLWPEDRPHDQRAAAAVCALSGVAVLGGGPGTGKTTTVARLLAVLREVSPGRPPRVALAAPTGKAAARLTESLASARATDPRLDDADRGFLAHLSASTLHRLLGIRRGSSRAWHSADNRLPHDVVVVDEASMVSLTLIGQLLEALRPPTRLLLVGDPDQLASVEAGAVLADLVAPARGGERTEALRSALERAVPLDVGARASPAPDTPAARVRDGVVLLRTVWRYDEGGRIAALAQATRSGNAEEALAVLRDGGDAIRFDEVADDAAIAGEVLERLSAQVQGTNRLLVEAAAAGDAGAALAALDRHRLLCAHRRGPRGVSHWSRTVQRWVVDELGVVPRRDGRYAGLPLLVSANDYDNKLYNGDTGVVVEADGDLVAVFGRGDGHAEIPLGRLAEVRPLHAMTVHRSQGSQFDRVTVLLPPASSPLGTRETLYTAVTRAVAGVHVIGSAEAVTAAVERPVARATGLRRRLA